VIDILGANRNYYFRGYGENFGRDDQYINISGGALPVVEGAGLQRQDSAHLSGTR